MLTIRVAVCEDDAHYCVQTTQMVEKWFCTRPNLEGKVTSFESGQVLLEAIDRSEKFDLYLLDVLMPGPNGIQIGAALRRLEETGEIIYLTSTPDFAVDSYGVGALFYLLKPVEEQKLLEVLDKAAARLTLRLGASIIVPTAEGGQRILLDDILYVEKVGRCARYVCAGETVESLSLQNSFKETVQPLVSDGRFCPCGVSFVLNLRRVRRVDGQAVFMTGGVTLELPRRVCGEFQQLWGEYWLKEEAR